ncbi:MAG: ATP-binding protein [Paludibacteraceae bacterium]|nr:ATP-binding protein [Paludibacteraceae bacterium]
METKLKNYPLGVYTFEKIRNGNYFYVDKTDYVYEIANKYNYVFLSRPRRFGKSLLVDTLQCYFEGRKELFAGLKADALEKDWVKYPVLRFDMSSIKSYDIEGVKNKLNTMLIEYEKKYGKEDNEVEFSDRMIGIMKRAHTATGQKVVLLIDEYDSALLNVMHNKPVFEELRNILRSFYSPIKICDAIIRFGFITGITKFSQLSIFSEINNLTNISMLPDYDGLCGITKDELLTQCKPDIQALADELEISYDDAVAKLTENYDGYHFSVGRKNVMTDVFNPFSLINAFSARNIGQYWYSSGTPTFLFGEMRKYKTELQNIEGRVAGENEFNVSPEVAVSALPMLYQSGYLTIKKADTITRLFTLGFPNKEVKEGFLQSFLPMVSNISDDESNRMLVRVVQALYADDIDTALTEIKAYIAAIPYYYENKTEPAFQTIMYLILTLLGQNMRVEVPFAVGRTDAILETTNTIYIIEYKVDKSTDIALQQIDDMHYADPYLADPRRKLKVGINFTTESRTIESWKAVAIPSLPNGL